MCCGGVVADVFETVVDVVEDVGGAVVDVVEDVAGAVGDVAEGVFDVVEDVGEGVFDVVGDVAEGVFDVVEDVGDVVFDALDSVTDSIDNLMENPAALISVGLSLAAPGIGSVIGGALGATGTAATVLGNSIMSGVMAEASGADFIEGAFASAVTGGFGAYAGDVGAVLGIEDAALAKTVGNAVTKAGSAAVLGKDVASTFLETAIVDGITTGAFKPSTTGAPDITPDNIDIGGGWNPAGVDTTPDNIDIGGGWNPADIITSAGSVIDATEREGTLAKETPGLDWKGAAKTAVKFAAATGVGPAVATTAARAADKSAALPAINYREKKGKELYKDAPIAGYEMVKMQDDSGQVKYIPFINDKSLLPVPAGFKRAPMARGGFVQRRS